MKCPKCGYNSFESHDSCKKCSSDLISYKQTYGITPIVLPLEVREKMAKEFRVASAEAEQQDENAETHDDMFAFDLPEEPPAPTASFNNNPFNFDDKASVAGAGQVNLAEDPFADLLETTSQAADAPFGTPPALPKAAAPASSPGEFDLDNFSWDDTPAATSETAGQDTSDDFDSLFGSADETANK